MRVVLHGLERIQKIDKVSLRILQKRMKQGVKIRQSMVDDIIKINFKEDSFCY